MTKEEVLHTRYGEMLDLISCYQIENCGLKLKKHTRKKPWTYDEAIALL